MKRSVLILLVFSAISFVATLLPRYIERNKSLQELMSVRSEQKQETKSGVNNPNHRNESMLLFMKREVEEIERLKNRSGGESEVEQDSVSGIVKELISAYSEYENEKTAIFAVLELNAINTTDDICKSIKRAKQAEIIAKRIELLNKEMEAKLKESLVERRDSSSSAYPAMRGISLIADIKRRRELYKMNTEVIREARLVLEVLSKEWGAWEYNVEEGGVLFASEDTVIEFNSVMERIGVLVLKIKELQLLILKAQAANSG